MAFKFHQKIDTDDIVGKTTGMLTVVAFARKEPYLNRYTYIYECLCECGNTIFLPRTSLLTPHTKSCGCIKELVHRKEHNPSWRGVGDISSTMYRYFKTMARSRKLVFDLSKQQLWDLFVKQGKCCALSGVPLVFDPVTSNISPNTSASLDRIDSSKGYTLDNVQWVHKEINWMKNRFSQDTFIRWCSLVTNNASKDT